MDLETENRIAAILLKEARELRQQADREGALAYLREPTVRIKPNSRFLTATVRGVQQANRAVEVNEMWRLREKEQELDNRVRNRSGSGRRYEEGYDSQRSSSRDGLEPSAGSSRASNKRAFDDFSSATDEGLRDEDMEKFLHSRVKRGRGAVGSRMDETGPYLPSCPRSASPDDEPRKARVLGPERPPSLKRRESSDDESDDESQDEKKPARRHSSKHRSSKHKSNLKSKDEKRKKRRDEKKRKHRR